MLTVVICVILQVCISTPSLTTCPTIASPMLCDAPWRTSASSSCYACHHMRRPEEGVRVSVRAAPWRP